MFTRRRFLVSLGAAAGSARLLRSWQKEPEPEGRRLYRRALSRPLEKLQEEYDVAIIGSGYGGGISAERLAGHGETVCVLERGKEFRGGAKGLDFPSRNVPELMHEVNGSMNPLGLYDVRHGKDLGVLIGCGLGGTSLINANVMYLPEAALFDDRRWPAEVSRVLLTSYYARAGKVLRAELYAPELPLKAQRFKGASAEVGEWKLVPIAVTTRDHPVGGSVDMMHCVGCASCVSGCNFSAKNTVDMTYLPMAEAAGAEIFTRIRVQTIAKDKETGRYVLHYEAHGEKGTTKGTLTAKLVILAAGALGSTELLLRSRSAHNLEVSPALGTQFSGNGDFLEFAYNTEAPAAIATGPTIVSSTEVWDSPNVKDHVIIEEGAIPIGLLDTLAQTTAMLKGLQPSTVERSSKEKFEDWQRTLKDLHGFRKDGALNNSVCFLGMGHDNSVGRIVIDKLHDYAVADYPGYAKEPIFQRLDVAMKKITTALGGVYLKNPLGNAVLWQKLTTVHPLGGCPMDGRDAEKVVNHLGQVHGHENLYVLDGAILPTAVGVNPSFTISALAERTSEYLQQKLEQL